MEPELIKEKFHNLEKWKDEVSPVIWDNKSKSERIMDTLDELKRASKEDKKNRRQINVLLVMAILSPIIAIIISKLLGGS